ncbi:MAG TPA: hypothetical protein DEO73_17525 [Pantoea sp.]|nr:hypothetical protein [Pantoea sp.]
MISDERLKEILGALCTDSLHDYEQVFDGIENGEIGDMAKELLALRKAFSEPVAFTAQSNLDGFGGSVGYMWPPGNEKPTDVALYQKSTDSTT